MTEDRLRELTHPCETVLDLINTYERVAEVARVGRAGEDRGEREK